ncbi:DTW domain-containing protein YfiP [Undibacterium sp. GrIS 1.8]|uniref:tRNA-uridine aminocarboxypropyltransferase n=1 Tax=unclassified Undibacterium TaxID=2630295 RepID=UPI003397F57D
MNAATKSCTGLSTQQGTTQTAKRSSCTRCLRPQSTCICHWIVAINPQVEIVILQHPLEVQNAKGSARLLHLSLTGSQICIGEKFEESLLKSLLDVPGKNSILLYPETPQDQGIGVMPAPVFDVRLLAQPDKIRLIVLDGTWRKSRKMLYLNPLLQTLPRLPLRDTATSLYRIRKAHKPDQLSSLEATCYALMMLENTSEKYQPLLDAFDGFVGQQEALKTSHYSASDAVLI